jgi:hypothetical protein
VLASQITVQAIGRYIPVQRIVLPQPQRRAEAGSFAIT